METNKLPLAQRKKDIIDRIDKVADLIPGVLIIHELPELRLAYMSPRGLAPLDMNLEELIALGAEYNYRYFNEADALDYVPKVFAMLERNDLNELVSFFQQVRPAPGAPYNWHMSTSKILIQDDEGRPALAITIAQPIDLLHNITHKLDRLLKENEFIRANYTKFSTLSRRELEVLKLLGRSKSTQEISELLFISLHTVESHRKNIRRKLDLKTNYDQEEYVRAFNLI